MLEQRDWYGFGFLPWRSPQMIVHGEKKKAKITKPLPFCVQDAVESVWSGQNTIQCGAVAFVCITVLR